MFRGKTWTLAAAGLLLSTSYSVAAVFPIGLYGVDEPTALPQIKKAGFDAIQSYNPDPSNLEALAQGATSAGISLLIYPDQAMRQSARATGRWPVLAWYLQDEPDVSGVTPAVLKSKADRVRSWDPNRREAFVVGQGSAVAPYAEVGDVVMVDWYPVPHLALDSVADQLDIAHRALPRGKPVWAVIQAFDWREYPQRHPRRPRIGRFPTQAEMRFMSYLAVFHGASGLFYFTFSHSGRTLLDEPELWMPLAAVSGEMNKMRAIWVSGHPIDLPFAVSGRGVEARAWRFQGRDYVIIVNRSLKSDVPAPDALFDARWRPLFAPARSLRNVFPRAGQSSFLPPQSVTVVESRLL